MDKPGVIRTGFSAGQLVATKGVADLCQQDPRFAEFVKLSLQRHLNGDWGDVDSEDQQTNNRAVTEEERILSAYNDDRFPKNSVATIWIITEADRSVTTILFPDEY
jgi:hypothetical protein